MHSHTNNLHLLSGPILRIDIQGLEFRQHAVIANCLAKHGILAIEMRRRGKTHKELAAVAIRTAICHA